MKSASKSILKTFTDKKLRGPLLRGVIRDSLEPFRFKGKKRMIHEPANNSESLAKVPALNDVKERKSKDWKPARTLRHFDDYLGFAKDHPFQDR